MESHKLDRILLAYDLPISSSSSLWGRDRYRVERYRESPFGSDRRWEDLRDSRSGGREEKLRTLFEFLGVDLEGRGERRGLSTGLGRDRERDRERLGVRMLEF